MNHGKVNFPLNGKDRSRPQVSLLNFFKVWHLSCQLSQTQVIMHTQRTQTAYVYKHTEEENIARSGPAVISFSRNTAKP